MKKLFKNRFILGIFCVVLAALLSFVAAPIAEMFTSKNIEVVRAKSNILSGTKITREMLELKSMGKSNLPEATIKNLDDAIGKYATCDIGIDDIITEKKASSAPHQSPYLHDLPDGMLAVAIALKNDAAGLCGKLRAEDIISVFASPTQANDSTSYSALAFAELKYLRVLDVFDAENHEVQQEAPELSEQNEKEEVSTVILMASPRQAELLCGLDNNSTIHTVLVVRGDKESADKYLAMQNEYLSSAPTQSKAKNETEG